MSGPDETCHPTSHVATNSTSPRKLVENIDASHVLLTDIVKKLTRLGSKTTNPNATLEH